MFLVRDFQRPLPRAPFPAARERFVFQFVEVLFAGMNQTGLQRAEPIVVLPVECRRAQRVTRQLRQRVVRDPFAAVEKKGDFIAMKYAAQHVMVAVQRAHHDGHVAKTSATAHVTQNLSRGKRRFRLRVRADNDAQ